MAGTRDRLVGGIEAGGTKFVCAIGTGPDDVRAETRIATTTPAETIRRALAFFAERQRVAPIAAIGVASFGPIDLRRGSPTWGFITTTPKAGWTDTDLVGPIAERLEIPVAFDTDVNAAALAEHRWGAGRNMRSIVYVTVGTGIGGGAVVEGRAVHGLVHPEMGHVRVPRDSSVDPFPGVCPYHGDCLEGLASGPAMEARWGVPSSHLPAEHPAWRLEARYLAVGLANIIAVLSPERIVLGGGVMQHAGLFACVRADLLELLGRYVRASAINDDRIASYVVAPALGERSGILGAIALALDVLAEEDACRHSH